MAKPKLKKIPTAQVRLGMYIEGFCGSWMEHPFWRSKFVITDADELRLVHECAIKEVLIDVSQGLDVEPAAATNAASATNVAEPQPPATPEPPPAPDTEAASMRAEYQRAAAICNAATGAVRHMFAEVRMGRAIDPEVARQVAEEITDSVLRNGGALISLARLKTADAYTYMHSVAVCALMVALARQLGLSEAETRAAGFAGLMHDLGKADVPLEVLNKPGRLTEAEFDQVRLHPEHGHRRLLAAGVDDPMALDVCLHHHERLDGKGYPKRLAREADQGAAVAQHRIGDLLGHLARHLWVDGAAHAHLGKHVAHRAGGGFADGGGALILGAHRGRLGIGSRRWLGGCGWWRGCCGGVAGRGWHDIQALADVDQHLLDRALMQQAQLVRVGDHKLAAPKRVLHPRTAKTLDVHPQLHLRGRDFFQLGFGHGFRTSGERVSHSL